MFVGFLDWAFFSRVGFALFVVPLWNRRRNLWKSLISDSLLAWHFLKQIVLKRVRDLFATSGTNFGPEINQTGWYWVRNSHTMLRDYFGTHFGWNSSISRPDPVLLRASLLKEDPEKVWPAWNEFTDGDRVEKPTQNPNPPKCGKCWKLSGLGPVIMPYRLRDVSYTILATKLVSRGTKWTFKQLRGHQNNNFGSNTTQNHLWTSPSPQAEKWGFDEIWVFRLLSELRATSAGISGRFLQ